MSRFIKVKISGNLSKINSGVVGVKTTRDNSRANGREIRISECTWFC